MVGRSQGNLFLFPTQSRKSATEAGLYLEPFNQIQRHKPFDFQKNQCPIRVGGDVRQLVFSRYQWEWQKPKKH